MKSHRAAFIAVATVAFALGVSCSFVLPARTSHAQTTTKTLVGITNGGSSIYRAWSDGTVEEYCATAPTRWISIGSTCIKLSSP